MTLPDLDEWGDDDWWILTDDGRHQFIAPEAAQQRLDDGLQALSMRLNASPPPVIGVRDADDHLIDDGAARMLARDAVGVLAGERAELDDMALRRFVHACANLRAICGRIAEPGDGATDVEMALLADVVGRLHTESENEMLRRVRRQRAGGYRIRLQPGERDLLSHLTGQLDQMLESGDGALARLFPPAYGTDDDRSREYAALADHELISARRAALTTALEIIDAERTDESGALALLQSINAIRLVIGTRLDVSEDRDDPPAPDDPAADLWWAYHVLGSMLADLLTAMRP